LIETTLKENDLYNPKTEQYAETMKYPDVTRIFPYESETKTHLYKKDITSIIAALKEAKKVVNKLKNKDVDIELLDNKLTITGITRYVNDNDEKKEDLYEKSFDIDWSHEDLTICVNSVLLINVLSAMKKYLSNFDKDGYIIAEFYGKMRPILFTSKDEKFQTLVCPMRKIK
jgi:DNA polymerase III sliding clamp (beta) subunit (PCNA family)